MTTMIDATPREQMLLQLIARMRSAQIPDSQIFDLIGSGDLAQAGGWGYLPYIADFAGINQSYNLGLGNLAQNAQQDYYNRLNSPYNVVSGLQMMRDTGASGVLSDPTLASVQPSPASGYQAYLDSLFNPATSPQASAAANGAPATAGNAVAGSVNPTGQSWIDAWRAYHPGEPDPVSGYATNAVNTGAQQGAARLLGSTLGGVGTATPGFRTSLAAGKVPGFSSINQRDMGLLSNDQRQAYMGLVGSTGRVSDPAAAYNDYLRVYSHR